MEDTKKKLEIMQAFLDGKKIQWNNRISNAWTECKNPSWNWNFNSYRIEEKTTPKPEDYKQVKYKYKDYESAFITTQAFLSIEDFYNICKIKPTDIEWAIFI